MCGASSQQEQLETEQADFYAQATAEANTAFQEQQGMISQFQSIYNPILAKGENQQGFSAAETEALNSQAVEGTAQNYAGAAKALNENLAAQGGGNISLTSGEQTQLKAELAASSASSESQQETQIQEADYAQGQQNFQNASNALATVSGELNPTAYENSASTAGSDAASTANQIAQENNSWYTSAIGAAGSIGGGLMSNPNVFK